MFQIQGALNELPAAHSPAGNRDAAYVLNIAGAWEKPEDDAVNVAWARDCFEATRGFSTGGTYINFLTEDEGPRARGGGVWAGESRSLGDAEADLRPGEPVPPHEGGFRPWLGSNCSLQAWQVTLLVAYVLR